MPVDAATKRPLVKAWTSPGVARPLADREALARWLARPGTALAVLCGPQSGVLVIDCDRRPGLDGFRALEALGRELGPLPPTAVAATPSGGEHRFYAWPAGVERIPSRPLRPGVDVRATGALAVLPCGAIRTPGRRWLAHPAEQPLAELPPAWIGALRPPPPPPPAPKPKFGAYGSNERYLEAALARAFDGVASAPVGARNVTLNAAAWSLARLDDLPSAAIRDVLVAAAARCGLPRREAEATIASALRARRGGRP